MGITGTDGEYTMKKLWEYFFVECVIVRCMVGISVVVSSQYEEDKTGVP